MKQKPIPKPTEELKAKCDAKNQFSNLDRLFPLSNFRSQG